MCFQVPKKDLLQRFPVALSVNIRVPNVFSLIAVLILFTSIVIIFVKRKHLLQPFPNQEHPSKREMVLEFFIWMLSTLCYVPMGVLNFILKQNKENEKFESFKWFNLLTDCLPSLYLTIIISAMVLGRLRNYRKFAFKNLKDFFHRDKVYVLPE